MNFDKRYFVELKTIKKDQLLWLNGGVGYTEDELPRLIRKIKNDKRILEYRIIEHRILGRR